jgi:hypothetical protein
MLKSLYHLYIPLLCKGSNGNEILNILDSFVDADEVDLMVRMNRYYEAVIVGVEF